MTTPRTIIPTSPKNWRQPSSGLNLASLAGFNVNVIETLLSGGRFPTNSTVTVQYDYTVTTPTSGVPEPSTYAMIGLGLSALAFARRRA